jgi:hypothetical protein
VLLEVVALTTNVRDHLKAIGQANLGHFPQGGVWLFRGRGVDAGADPTALRAGLKRWALALDRLSGSALANQLVNGRHFLKILWLFFEFHYSW